MAYTAIDDSGLFMNPVLYTGTGSSLAITGVGFQPDFTWIKGRSFTDDHVLTDAVRGVTKTLYSNEVNAEETQTGGLTAFGADGFTVGSMAEVNTSSATLVSWNWKAGTTTGITTDGSTTITPSSYSFNQTPGFSCIAYTGNGTSGAKVAHGLGAALKMIIVKRLNSVSQWTVYTSALGATKYMVLDTTTDLNDEVWAWNDTEPDSVNFTLGDSDYVNNNTSTYIAYCFADVAGYSKVGGSYTGNGLADGTFVYTGFKPAFVMIKRTDAGGHNWQIHDNKRSSSGGGNLVNSRLLPNVPNVEYTDTIGCDFLSNGFKLRTDNASYNDSGGTYIYMAFAEAPFVNSNGVPCTAR